MSKNRGKSKLSNSVLFNVNKHVFHCEKSLGTLFYGQPSYIYWLMFLMVFMIRKTFWHVLYLLMRNCESTNFCMNFFLFNFIKIIDNVRVQLPALPDILRSSGSGMGST
jgi:hypothetical protein